MFSDDFIKEMGFDKDSVKISPFINEEDGEEYEVWKIEAEEKTFVFKKEKGKEAIIYENYLSVLNEHAPKFYGIFEHGGEKYLLMEYFDGETTTKCDRIKLKNAIDALIGIQKTFWNSEEAEGDGYYNESLLKRKKRGEFLFDEEIEKAYGRFLKRYEEIPRTLCHDDLLPFNILSDSEKAVIIDWEYAGILPYLVSFSRFIAHFSSEEDAFFFLEDGEKEWAIDYYYNNFIKEKGIQCSEFMDDLDLFLLYEYCEWVMIGNKYEDAKGERFYQYLSLAKEKAGKINSK